MNGENTDWSEITLRVRAAAEKNRPVGAGPGIHSCGQVARSRQRNAGNYSEATAAVGAEAEVVAKLSRS